MLDEVAECGVAANRVGGDVDAATRRVSRLAGGVQGLHPLDDAASHPSVEQRHEALLLEDRQERSRGHQVALLLVEADEDLAVERVIRCRGRHGHDGLEEQDELLVLEIPDQAIADLGADIQGAGIAQVGAHEVRHDSAKRLCGVIRFYAVNSLTGAVAAVTCAWRAALSPAGERTVSEILAQLHRGRP